MFSRVKSTQIDDSLAHRSRFILFSFEQTVKTQSSHPVRELVASISPNTRALQSAVWRLLRLIHSKNEKLVTQPSLKWTMGLSYLCAPATRSCEFITRYQCVVIISHQWRHSHRREIIQWKSFALASKAINASGTSRSLFSHFAQLANVSVSPACWLLVRPCRELKFERHHQINDSDTRKVFLTFLFAAKKQREREKCLARGLKWAAPAIASCNESKLKFLLVQSSAIIGWLL